MFRELLQNSDDAGSSKVEIRFERDRRKGTLPDLKSTSVLALCPSHAHPVLLIALSKFTRWTFSNNGKEFTEKDQERLRTIGVLIMVPFPRSLHISLHSPAEGNPDPEKIGAFGVGE